jgi:FkbM family methyltransferase
MQHPSYFRAKFIRRLKKYLIDSLIIILGAYAPSLLWKKTTYSQAGEDIILGNLFQNKSNGTYIDVGCHHPFRNSNTYLLYKMGWKGLCIDPGPKVGKLFAIWRPKDIFINLAIAEQDGSSQLFVFNDPALNSLCTEQVKNFNNFEDFKLIEEITVPTTTLKEIHKAYESALLDLDILSVDVEGLDLVVLKSNDWASLRPKVVVFELRNADLANILDNHCYQFMNSLGYELYVKTENNLIMLDSNYHFFSRG